MQCWISGKLGIVLILLNGKKKNRILFLKWFKRNLFRYFCPAGELADVRTRSLGGAGHRWKTNRGISQWATVSRSPPGINSLIIVIEATVNISVPPIGLGAMTVTPLIELWSSCDHGNVRALHSNVGDYSTANKLEVMFNMCLEEQLEWISKKNCYLQPSKLKFTSNVSLLHLWQKRVRWHWLVDTSIIVFSFSRGLHHNGKVFVVLRNRQSEERQ